MADFEYRGKFIDFLIRSQALRFGEFTTKSGRSSPYFVNTGCFDSGARISELGRYYAMHAQRVGLAQAGRLLFGPAYKGIPLAIATSIALFRDFGVDLPYAFDRKEVKTHGDGGRFVGRQPVSGDRLVMVEDVITAGTTLREMLPTFKTLGVVIEGVLISVDRCERGTGDVSAVQQVESELGVKVYPIVTIRHIVEYLQSTERPEAHYVPAIERYLATYGVCE